MQHPVQLPSHLRTGEEGSVKVVLLLAAAAGAFLFLSAGFNLTVAQALDRVTRVFPL